MSKSIYILLCLYIIIFTHVFVSICTEQSLYILGLNLREGDIMMVSSVCFLYFIKKIPDNSVDL